MKCNDETINIAINKNVKKNSISAATKIIFTLL